MSRKTGQIRCAGHWISRCDVKFKHPHRRSRKMWMNTIRVDAMDILDEINEEKQEESLKHSANVACSDDQNVRSALKVKEANPSKDLIDTDKGNCRPKKPKRRVCVVNIADCKIVPIDEIRTAAGTSVSGESASSDEANREKVLKKMEDVKGVDFDTLGCRDEPDGEEDEQQKVQKIEGKVCQVTKSLLPDQKLESEKNRDGPKLKMDDAKFLETPEKKKKRMLEALDVLKNCTLKPLWEAKVEEAYQQLLRESGRVGVDLNHCHQTEMEEVPSYDFIKSEEFNEFIVTMKMEHELYVKEMEAIDWFESLDLESQADFVAWVECSSDPDLSMFVNGLSIKFVGHRDKRSVVRAMKNSLYAINKNETGRLGTKEAQFSRASVDKLLLDIPKDEENKLIEPMKPMTIYGQLGAGKTGFTSVDELLLHIHGDDEKKLIEPMKPM